MLILHYQVHGKERFPKLFSYEKLFVRFAKYQNAKGLIAQKAKVCLGLIAPKFGYLAGLWRAHVNFTLSSAW